MDNNQNNVQQNMESLVNPKDNNAKSEKIKKKNNNNNNKFIDLFAMLFVVILVADVFVIISFRDKYGIVAGCIAATCIVTFILASKICKEVNEHINNKNQQFEDFMKSQKAIYKVNKSGFESINEKLDSLLESVNSNKKEIINTDKAIAKTLIKSNNEKIEEIKAAISGIDLKVDLPEKDDTYNLAFDIEKLRQSLVGVIDKLSSDLIASGEKIGEELGEKISNISITNVVAPVSEGATAVAEEPAMEEGGSALVEEEPAPAEVSATAEAVAPAEELVTEEALAETSGLDLSDPNRQLSADDIAALFASMGQ